LNKFKDKISPIIFILFLSILGFISGILTIAFWQENWLICDGVLGQEFVYQIEDLNINKRALFFLCMEKRLRAFFILFLLAFSTVNVFSNITFFFLHGLYIGSVMELFTIRYGIQGILVYLSMILPQGIFYIPGFLSLGCWCLNMEKIQGNVSEKKIGKLRKNMDKRRLGVAFMLVLTGILLESFVNSKIFFIFI